MLRRAAPDVADTFTGEGGDRRLRAAEGEKDGTENSDRRSDITPRAAKGCSLLSVADQMNSRRWVVVQFATTRTEFIRIRCPY